MDDRIDTFQRHPGVTGVKIGDNGYLEIETGRPLRRQQAIPREAEPQHGLVAEAIGRGRSAEGAKPGNKAKEMTARNHEWLIVMPPMHHPRIKRDYDGSSSPLPNNP